MNETSDPWLRAADLVAQLTVDEKIAFCHQHVPAVERLGLRPFVTGSEAAHGVAWLGLATVFPQPVGLAATWDPELIRRVGEAVGVELRAKHAEDPTISLNAWAPVVNPLRNPLWGRNEEGFSEDPHLTAELATAYAQGLRGDHPTVWRTVPTLKHFLGYNNETDRDVSSSTMRPRVLAEYELPAYAGPIAAGVIGAVMPSYNLVNHRPAHVSHALLDRLRAFTERSLLVVSDAFAPGNLAGSQHYFDDHVTSHAAALHAGVDSFTEGGKDSSVITDRLTEALARGLITEDDLDLAATRLLHLRILTGELDAGSDPYASITAADLDTSTHRSLARESAAKSVVLLANGTGLLPLQEKKSLAVVGPFAHRVVHDWYSGTPPYLVGLTSALQESCSDVRAAEGTDVITLLATSTQRYLSVDPASGVVAASALSAEGAERLVLDDWGHGTVTLTAANGRLLTGAGGRHVTATATRVGGWEVQESFGFRRFDDGTWALEHLGSGKWLRIQQQTGRLEAGAPTAESAERFLLSTVVSGLAAVADAAGAADVVVVTAGNDPHLWGRETQDRPDLWLPSRQREILRTARAANPQCVLVIVSSYPYVLDPVERGCPAIMWTSHAGQELGHGVADVLIGAQEPYGRLAQAWPSDPQQVSDLLDYDVIASRQTYWYSDHPALYGFGHGLTYAEPSYGEVSLDEEALTTAAESTSLWVKVSNPGDRATTEIIQVYARRTTPDRLVTPCLLVGHSRVALEPGQEISARVDLDLTRLRIWDVRGQAMTLLPGTYAVTVGRSARDVRGHVSVTITGEVAGPTVLKGTTLRAADFDDLNDADLVPDLPLVGEAVTTRGQATTASIDFWNLDLSSLSGLSLKTRGTGGCVRLLHRPTVGDDAWILLGSGDVTPSVEWTDTTIGWDLELPVTDLRIEIPAGLKLLSLG